MINRKIEKEELDLVIEDSGLKNLDYYEKRYLRNLILCHRLDIIIYHLSLNYLFYTIDGGDLKPLEIQSPGFVPIITDIREGTASKIYTKYKKFHGHILLENVTYPTSRDIFAFKEILDALDNPEYLEIKNANECLQSLRDGHLYIHYSSMSHNRSLSSWLQGWSFY